MSKQFFITEFWTGPEGQRQLYHSETTEQDPTLAIRNYPPGKFFSGKPVHLLIITFPVRQWAKPKLPPLTM
jgi:hypothetical protein